MRWVKRLLLAAGQVEMAICHKKGFPLETGGQQVHAHDWAGSWRWEPQRRSRCCLSPSIRPSIHLTKVYSSILSVQPYYHKRLLLWRTGTAFLCNHPADSWAALCRRLGGNRASSVHHAHAEIQALLHLIRATLDRKPWQLDEVPFFWMYHQFPTPRSFKKVETLPTGFYLLVQVGSSLAPPVLLQPRSQDSHPVPLTAPLLCTCYANEHHHHRAIAVSLAPCAFQNKTRIYFHS